MDLGTIRTWLLPEFRGRLRERGMARDLIWRDGALPDNAPAFSPSLSDDLLSYAFGMLLAAMSLVDDGETDIAVEAFAAAGEAIESAVRRNTSTERHGFLAVVGAAAYHLARQNAMAVVLLRRDYGPRSESATLFVDLLTRRLGDARDHIRSRSRSVADGDAHAPDVRIEVEVDDDAAATRALAINYERAVAAVIAFFATGADDDLTVARERLEIGVDCAGGWGFSEAWWLHRLTALLLDDFGERCLHRSVPQSPIPSLAALRESYIDVLGSRYDAVVDLWPSQLEAARHAFDDADLVLALPTSSGKTRIAELCMLPVLAGESNVLYVTPLRALSAQIEHDLDRVFRLVGQGFSVSHLYDGGGEERDQPRIQVSTPERLDFALRHDESILDRVGLIVFDEGHMIGPEPREVRYELLIERVRRARVGRSVRIVCLSAMLPAPSATTYADWLAGDDGEAVAVRNEWRPSRLNWGTVQWRRDHARLDLEVGAERPFVEHLLDGRRSAGRRRSAFPQDDRELVLGCVFRLIELGETVLLFSPSRRSVEPDGEAALRLKRQGLIRLPEFDAEAHVSPRDRATLDEWLGADHRVTQCLLRGIALHHGQLPDPVRSIVERLIREQAVKLVIASPTVAQGMNVTASTVFFQTLTRRDPVLNAERPIRPEEFLNVVGRAGRAFVDSAGKVMFCTGVDRRRAAARLREWSQIRRIAERRNLESGLATLVIRLMEQLGGFDDGRTEFLTEHVNVDRSMNDAELDADSPDRYDGGVDELDQSINNLLGSAGVTEEDVARHLDAVLRGSLLRRTLAQHEEDVRLAVERVLTGRARGIVRRTTSAARIAAYRADITPRLSSSFADLVASIGADVATIEGALARGAFDVDLRRRLTEVTVAILAFPTFASAATGRVDDPEGIVRSWLEGRSLPDLVGGSSANQRFIEEGVQSRAVWGYDAVRRAVFGADPPAVVTGAVLLANGAPDPAAALLLRDGMTSRSLAVAIGALVPEGAATSAVGLRAWMAADPLGIVAALPVEQRPAFETFLKSRGDAARNAEDFGSRIVADAFTAAPVADSLVFVFINDDGSFEVTDRDLQAFARGQLPAQIPAVVRGRWLDGVVELRRAVRVRP